MQPIEALAERRDPSTRRGRVSRRCRSRCCLGGPGSLRALRRLHRLGCLGRPGLARGLGGGLLGRRLLLRCLGLGQLGRCGRRLRRRARVAGCSNQEVLALFSRRQSSRAACRGPSRSCRSSGLGTSARRLAGPRRPWRASACALSARRSRGLGGLGAATQADVFGRQAVSRDKRLDLGDRLLRLCLEQRDRLFFEFSDLLLDGGECGHGFDTGQLEMARV